MTVNSNMISALAVEKLQRERRAANIPQRTIANELGVSRQTVNQKFQAGDMKLTEFIIMAFAVGVVPEFLRTLVFARPRGDDQFADCTFSPSLDMSR